MESVINIRPPKIKMFDTKHFNLKKILKPESIQKPIQTLNHNTINIFITINNIQNSYLEKKLNAFRQIDESIFRK